MIKKLIFLVFLWLLILGANAYFLPQVSQEVALTAVNGSAGTWRAYNETRIIIGILEFVGFCSVAALLLLKRKTQQNSK